jgi:hypothetical protein
MEGRQVSGAAVLGEAIGGLLGALWTGTRVVYRIKDPATHTIVCQCICWEPPDEKGGRQGHVQTFAEREDCGKLSGISCEGTGYYGKLDGCEKKSVPTRLAPEQVRDDLLVKSER